MKNNFNRNVRIAIVFIVLLNIILFAQNQKILKGISGVYVLINASMIEDLELRGVTKSRIKTDVELRLRQAGIKVISKDEYLKSPDAALNVDIAIGKSRSLIIYSISMGLHETVLLDRDQSIRTVSTTWLGNITLGFHSLNTVSKIRNEVLDLVDDFINDYYAANTE